MLVMKGQYRKSAITDKISQSFEIIIQLSLYLTDSSLMSYLLENIVKNAEFILRSVTDELTDRQTDERRFGYRFNNQLTILMIVEKNKHNCQLLIGRVSQ